MQIHKGNRSCPWRRGASLGWFYQRDKSHDWFKNENNASNLRMFLCSGIKNIVQKICCDLHAIIFIVRIFLRIVAFGLYEAICISFDTALQARSITDVAYSFRAILQGTLIWYALEKQSIKQKFVKLRNFTYYLTRAIIVIQANSNAEQAFEGLYVIQNI